MANHRRWPYGYYTYIFYVGDMPYWVGCGKNNRANPKRLSYKPDDVLVVILEQESKELARYWEETLIRKFGRRDLGTGPLLNRTFGMGSKGRIRTIDELECIAAGQRGRKWTKKQREAASNRMLGNKRALGLRHSEETKQKISLKGKGRKLDLSFAERKRRAKRIRERNSDGRTWHARYTSP